MTPDFEERVVSNPAFGALLTRVFCEAFEGKRAGRDSASIGQILIALPMLFHRPTVNHVKAMQFDTGLAKAVAERTAIVTGLQGRVMRLAPASLNAIAVACSAGLLSSSGEAPGIYRVTQRPLRAHPASIEVDDALKAAKRLGSWFSLEPLPVLCRLLQVRF